MDKKTKSQENDSNKEIANGPGPKNPEEQDIPQVNERKKPKKQAKVNVIQTFKEKYVRNGVEKEMELAYGNLDKDKQVKISAKDIEERLVVFKMYDEGRPVPQGENRRTYPVHEKVVRITEQTFLARLDKHLANFDVRTADEAFRVCKFCTMKEYREAHMDFYSTLRGNTATRNAALKDRFEKWKKQIQFDVVTYTTTEDFYHVPRLRLEEGFPYDSIGLTGEEDL